MSEIAALSSGCSAARLAADYSVSVTKKVMDTQELAAQELARMLPAVQPSGEVPAQLRKGQYIDVYA